MKLGSNLHALAGAIVLVIVGAAIGARLSRPPAGADITEGGSPLYKIAVEESIRGLLSKKDDKGSVKDGVCPKCGEVHASPAPAGVGPPVAPGAKAGKPPPEQGAPCPKCGKIHHPPHGDPATAAAHSAGGAGKDYVYCAKCKVYHRRQSRPTTDHTLTSHR